MTTPKPIDHIGWSLFQAFATWKNMFNQAMAAQGCVWMAEARGTLVQHIGPSGIAQHVLVDRSGLTKQAVQQHLDGLVADGVVERVADPADARRKRVQLTSKGKQAAVTAQQIKQALQADIAKTIGPEKLDSLMTALGQIADMND